MSNHPSTTHPPPIIHRHSDDGSVSRRSRTSRPSKARTQDYKESARDRRDMTELLTEVRILLPGTQVFLAFLVMLPFYDRFAALSEAQRDIYLGTFLANILALACFVVPAAYHRIARPIHDKERFKILATRLMILGLVPLTISIVLVTYLVCSMLSTAIGVICAAAVAVALIVLWWVSPLLRIHDRCTPPR